MLGERVLREAPVFDQLPVSGRFLDRIEIRAMDVLDESALERTAIVGFDDHDGDFA
jgi:hypothetical protein